MSRINLVNTNPMKTMMENSGVKGIDFFVLDASRSKTCNFSDALSTQSPQTPLSSDQG